MNCPRCALSVHGKTVAIIPLLRGVRTVAYHKPRAKKAQATTPAAPSNTITSRLGQRNGPDSAAVVAQIVAEYEEKQSCVFAADSQSTAQATTPERQRRGLWMMAAVISGHIPLRIRRLLNIFAGCRFRSRGCQQRGCFHKCTRIGHHSHCPTCLDRWDAGKI